MRIIIEIEDSGSPVQVVTQHANIDEGTLFDAFMLGRRCENEGTRPRVVWEQFLVERGLQQPEATEQED